MSKRSRNVSVNQAMGRTRKSATAQMKKVNVADWPLLMSGTYRSELFMLYKLGKYACRGKSFEQVATLKTGELYPYTARVGLHEPFDVRFIVTNLASLQKASGARPWEPKYYHKKVMITVDPSDEFWYERLMNKLLRHSGKTGDTSRMAIALVKADRRTSLTSSDKIVLLGQLMNPGMRGKEIYAIVEETNVTIVRPAVPMYARKVIERAAMVELQLGISSQMNSTPKPPAVKMSRRERIQQQKPQTSSALLSLKSPEKPLEGIAKELNERIAAEIYGRVKSAYEESLAANNSHKDARNRVQVLISSPLFVSDAVHSAIRDDAVYAKADAKTPTATEFFAKRQINIAELANEFSARIQPRVAQLDAKALFRPVHAAATTTTTNASGSSLIAGDSNAAAGRTQAFSSDVAKKAISEVAIGCGIWDSFKSWMNRVEHYDDGRCNPGPCADLVFGGAPYACHSHLPKVHCVPDRCIHDDGYHHHHHHEKKDRNEIKQRVIVRVHSGRRAAKKKNGGATAAARVASVTRDGDEEYESSSSGEEDVLLDRAHRKSKGLAYRHIHSDDDDDDDDDVYGSDHKRAHHALGNCCDEYVHLPVPHQASFTTVSTAAVASKGVSVASTATTTTTMKQLDHAHYSNFLSILRESGCLEDSTPSVYLALDDSVLTSVNAAKVRKGGCRNFIERYRVYCPANVHSLKHSYWCHPTLIGGISMVSAAGVHYAAKAAATGAHLVLDTGAVLKHATLSTVDFFTCHGVHHHHRFMPFPALHIHFPRTSLVAVAAKPAAAAAKPAAASTPAPAPAAAPNAKMPPPPPPATSTTPGGPMTSMIDFSDT